MADDDKFLEHDRAYNAPAYREGFGPGPVAEGGVRNGAFAKHELALGPDHREPEWSKPGERSAAWYAAWGPAEPAARAYELALAQNKRAWVAAVLTSVDGDGTPEELRACGRADRALHDAGVALGKAFLSPAEQAHSAAFESSRAFRRTGDSDMARFHRLKDQLLPESRSPWLRTALTNPEVVRTYYDIARDMRTAFVLHPDPPGTFDRLSAKLHALAELLRPYREAEHAPPPGGESLPFQPHTTVRLEPGLPPGRLTELRGGPAPLPPGSHPLPKKG